MQSIIITGGAGFIGSHVVRLFVNKYPNYRIINVDKLTYAGNLANLEDIENAQNYRFVRADICDFDAMCALMWEEKVTGIIHLAAESHVDRSIKDPFTFARTNVMGTLSLLQAARLCWESLPEKYEGKRFYHISTDEVYGDLEITHPEGIKSPLPIWQPLQGIILHMVPIFSSKAHPTIHIRPTPLPKRLQTTLYVHSTILMVCLPL